MCKEVVKNCLSCGHKNGNICMLSGYCWKTERTFPTKCGVEFKGWVLKTKRTNILTRLFGGEKLYNRSDVEHLRFIYDRLINVHHEHMYVDYIIRLKKIIDNLNTKS